MKTSPFEKIDIEIERHMHRLNLPGLSLAIVEGDRIVHQRGFGQARPGGQPPSPQTPFAIGSLTKSFTATAVMQLVEAGKVALDAPVQQYLPWFRVADPAASAQMTVRQLLNQTSGLPLKPGWQLFDDYDNSPGVTERQARRLVSVKLNRTPGSAFEYTDLNYNLLGLVIEAASGESYASYIQNHLFDPLKMGHSYTSKATAKQNGLAVGHQTWFGIPVAVPDLPAPTGSLPASQLISSAEDLAHYLIAHLNQGRYDGAQILTPAGMAELHRPAAEAITWGVSAGKYGMGWFIEQKGRTCIVSHSGMVPDFYAFMALLPEQKKGLVMLVNANYVMNEATLTEVGLRLATLLAGDTPAPIQLGAIPWIQRGLLLIPLLQMAGVAATLLGVRSWRRNPQRRPSRGRLWGQHILLPLLPNLFLASLPVLLRASGLYGFLKLFAPDFTWIALACGGFAGVWAFLRTGLILLGIGAHPGRPGSIESGGRNG